MKRLTTREGCQEIVLDYNVQFRYTDLDGSCRGFTCRLPDGYLIVIERDLCIEAIRKTIQHELCHIVLGHLDDDETTEAEKEEEVRTILSKIRKENKNDLSKLQFRKCNNPDGSDRRKNERP